MNRSMLNKTLAYRIVGCTAWVLSTAIVVYLWTVLGQRGIAADAANTTGYTTPLEFILGTSTAPLAVASIVLLHKANKLDPRYKPT